MKLLLLFLLLLTSCALLPLEGRLLSRTPQLDVCITNDEKDCVKNTAMTCSVLVLAACNKPPEKEESQ